jgi:glyoxylase-like metal-dependent hydrolase (beta-lactamase superfamily II)
MSDRAVQRFDTDNGARIYQIPVRAFPGMIAHTYVVIDGDYAALIDTGSGAEKSNADLEAGMAALRAQHGEPITWETLTRIIITHGHIDHCGGLGYVRARSAAPVAAHRLDREAIRDHSAFMTTQAESTAAFLRWVGVAEELIAQLGRLFGAAAQGTPGGEIATILADGDILDGRFTVIHTPGHCAGQVCLRLGDVLFCADHLLSATNPRLTPAHLEPHNGLALYLAALDRVATELDIRLGLAGHEAPIDDIYARIAAIRESHLSRLTQIRDLCREPQTILEMTAQIYPEMRQPGQLLLALQSIAARVEYLEAQWALASAITDGITRYHTIA